MSGNDERATMFKVGDRVQRRSDVFDESSKWLRGMVHAVRRIDGRPEYIVKWDGQLLLQNYLEHGIQPEEPR